MVKTSRNYDVHGCTSLIIPLSDNMRKSAKMSNIYNDVTPLMFKEYYPADFLFISNYEPEQTYPKEQIVFSPPNFYKSLIDGNASPLTDIESWEKIPSSINYVTDNDIMKAIGQAELAVNEKFGETKEDKITIFLHLVAFYLVLDKKNQSSGINGGFLGVASSKSVGDVSESYAIPQYILNNPLWSIYAQNGYGLKYLSLILPYLAVTIRLFRGRSTIG